MAAVTLPANSAAGEVQAGQPLVSVVVTTYTTARIWDVCELLSSLKQQTYRHFEVVFVAEGAPEIRERVEAYAAGLGLPAFKTAVNTGMPGLSPARNVGVESSSGEIVAFIDDDAVAEPDWAEKIVAAFAEHGDAIGLTGPAYPLWMDESMRWWPEEFYWILSCPTPSWTGYDRPTPMRTAWGANMAFAREAFAGARFSEEFLGGEKSGADDVDFSLHVRAVSGRRIYFDPAVQVQHRVYPNRGSSTFIRKKAYRDGYAKALLRSLYARDQDQGFDLRLESSLARRILVRFFPAALGHLLVQPRRGVRELWIATVALSSMAAGYAAGWVHTRMNNERRGSRGRLEEDRA